MITRRNTIGQVLAQRAALQPARRLFTFVSDRGQEQHATFAELDRQARALAAMLRERNLSGQRVLLLCPPGLDYIAALFGCFYSGAVAVPAYPPRLSRSLDRLQSIVADCQAAAAFTTANTLSGLRPLFEEHADLKALQWFTPCQASLDLADKWSEPEMGRDMLAMLQYTSGSTRTPRGVMLTHGNLLHNCDLMSRSLQINEESHGVFWLPLYHDLGLIGGVLGTMYAGGSSTLMSPVAFVTKPVRWLEAISRNRATHSAAPTIGYELCVREIKPEQVAGLDLSTWKYAGVGAEPVREATLRRFAEMFAPAGFKATAFTGSYGLAEATVFVTGSVRPTGPITLALDGKALQQNRVTLIENAAEANLLVGCGRPLDEVRLEIVNPETREKSGHDQVGEIWVAGESVAKGYWNHAEDTAAVFQGFLAESNDGPFLRTGDMGFVHDGELFITGRLKDLIILAGRNHYPQDIEATVEAAHASLKPGSTAAFSVEMQTEERVVVVAEVERGFDAESPDEVFRAVRQAVAEAHEVEVATIILVRSGKSPKTTSGKIQRRRCREMHLAGEFEPVAEWTSSAPSPESLTVGQASSLPSDWQAGSLPHEKPLPGEEEIQNWLIGRIAHRMNLKPNLIDVQAPFTTLGLNSLSAVQIASEMEVFLGQPVSPTLVYDYPTIEKLARYLAGVRSDGGLGSLEAERWEEPIAIIGIGCRFPGAPNPRAYWEMIRKGKDALTTMPAWRWGPDVPLLQKEFPAINRGGFMDNVDQFDPDFFNVVHREAATMDPQQRLLLEVSWEALEDAGLAPSKLQDSNSGVFVGISASEYIQILLRGDDRFDRIDAYMATGNAHSVAANRLSYLLNWHGPSFAVDTACSSALVAVHLACKSLLARECDLALTAGVNICLSPDLSLAFSRAGMLSPEGLCKVFDSKANGYVRGEGCGAVVMKRLSDALEAGDPVLAIIRGTAINQDGRTASLTAPSGPAQRANIQQALAAAGLRPTDITYVEAHGTGTSLGDPIEVNALAEVYGQWDGAPGHPAGGDPARAGATQPCLMGSVKANIGHLEAASAMAGLIKTVLMLQHKTVPPQAHFKALNPLIKLDGTRLKPNTQMTPWTVAEGRHRAAQNSFGFGGTNAHAILEEAPTVNRDAPRPMEGPRVLPLSGRTKGALEDLARNYLRYLDERAEVNLDDVCHMASVGRAHWEHRLAIEASSLAEVRKSLKAFLHGRTPAGVHVGEVQKPSRNGKAQDAKPQAAEEGSLAERYVNGADIDWTAVWGERPRVRLGLPTYPFQRQSYFPSHIVATPALLEVNVGLTSRPEFADHKVGGTVVTPATGYVELALAAATKAGSTNCALEDVKFQRPLILTGDEDKKVRVVEQKNGEGSSRYHIQSLTGVDQHSDKSWSDHASCGVANLNGQATLPAAIESLEALQARFTREVPVAEFYRRLSYGGLEYGPVFQGVNKLWLGKAETLGFVKPPEGASLAARLDACFQVAAPIVAEQMAGNDNLIVPAGVERLRVTELPDDGVWCWAKRNAESGNLDLTILDNAGTVRAKIDGLKLDQMPREMLGGKSPSEWHNWLYQVEWRALPSLAADWMPSVETLADRVAALKPTVRIEQNIDEIAEMIAALDQVSAAYVVEAFEELGFEPLPGERFTAQELCDQLGVKAERRPSLVRMLDVLAEDGYLRKTNAGWEVVQLLSASPAEARVLQLESLNPMHRGELELLRRCGGKLAGVLRGQVEPKDLLEAEDVAQFSRYSPFSRVAHRLLGEAVASALEKVPAGCKVRVLEIGAGTGGATAFLLRRLAEDRVEYVFSDANPAMLDAAKEKFGDHECVRFQKLDVEKDLAGQGVELHSFDVIVASDVMHGLDAAKALENCRKLLMPQGLFVDCEWTSPRRWREFTFLPAGERSLALAANQAGFVDVTAVDAESELSGQTLFLARGPVACEAKRPYVIFADGQGVADALTAADVPTVTVRPGDAFECVAPGQYRINPEQPDDFRRLLKEVESPQGLVYMWGLDATTTDLEVTQQRVLGGMLHLVKSVQEMGGQSPRIWFCTRGAQPVDGSLINPAQATLWGFARALGLERPEMRVTGIDLDQSPNATLLWQELLADGPEFQLAHHGGKRLTARMVRKPWKPLADRPVRLISTGPGTFTTLEFQPYDRRLPGPGEVEMDVVAGGLNFHDVLDAMGLFPYHRGWFGGEASGKVVAVGHGVENFQVGDEVVGMAPAAFATRCVTTHHLIAKKPANISHDEAATIPVTFLTSYYALIKIANLKQGEKVLIHAASGGVGLAAVQLAQWVGAEVFATAGNPEKRAYLESLGIRHVFDSRSLDFHDQIIERLGGPGIDVVLNSLINEAIPKSIDLLKQGGRFVEIGRLATWTPEQVAERRPDILYQILPIDKVAADDPSGTGASLQHIMDLVAEGKLRPLPMKVYSSKDVQDGFRFMASAKHIGKIVINVTDAAAAIDSAVSFKADATYLIVGGLGGLGLQVARWLAERGAKHLALMGRTGRSVDDVPLLRDMKSVGINVQVVTGDVAKRDDVARVVQTIDATMPPLKGVIHSAAVLDDALVQNLTWQRFETVLGSKVSGAWHLHELTQGKELDHFIVFSSVASVVGSPGQSNYCAANAFLDALVQERRRQGLPAVGINWGAWSEVGIAVKHVPEGGVAAQTGQIAPSQGLEVLEWVLGSGTDQLTVWPAEWATLIPQIPPGVLPLVDDFVAEAKTAALASGGAQLQRSEVVEQLRKFPVAERRERLLKYICEQVAQVLRLDSPDQLDPNRPLQELGFDSLLAIELRNVLARNLGCPLPATLLFEHPTLAGISNYVADTVKLDEDSVATGILPVEVEETTGKMPVTRTEDDFVAVVGMGCRYPGGAVSPEAFWQMLEAGTDAVRVTPPDRWDADAFFDADPDAAGMIMTRFGAFIDDVDQFDADFFEITPKEAAMIDPQHRLLLEVTWEALEHAGQAPDKLNGTQTGFFLGICNSDYGRLLATTDTAAAYVTTGNAMCVAAGRISHVLGLQGPCLATDTACSSSLVAVHLAVKSLLNGECNLALASGVNLILTPYASAAFSRLRLLAPDGRCKAFSADGDGFGRGEGVGVVVLKRLSDAKAAGDRILGVIRGSAVTHDGRSASLTAPNSASQVAVIKKALEAGGVDPSAVGYIEAHGTGTALGDPIEVSALATVYGKGRTKKQPLLIGSAKTNVAHLEGAAGIVGFMKAVLTVQHDVIPPSLHLGKPNPHIAWNDLPIAVTSEKTPWPQTKAPRTAAVSSFGLSGTNAHVVVEEYREPKEAAEERLPTLLTLSARNAAALSELAGRMADHLEVNPDASLNDFCWTLNAGRSHFGHRLALVARTAEQVKDALTHFAGGEQSADVWTGQSRRTTQPKVAFVFHDRTQDWPQALRELAAVEPVVKAELERLEAELGLDDDSPTLQKRWMLAAHLALTALWRSWGLEPTCVLGQGAALLSAAVVAGQLSVADARRLLAGDVDGLTWSEPRLGLVGDDGLWLRDGASTLAQLGREATSAAQGMQALRERGCDLVVNLGQDESTREQLLAALAACYVRGATIKAEGLDVRVRRRKVGLPTYPFQRRRHWVDAAQPVTVVGVATTSLAKPASGPAAHPLLGKRVVSPLPDVQFESVLGPRCGWRDASLSVSGPTVPGAALIAQAQVALDAAGGRAPYVFENVELGSPLTLPGKGESVMQVILSPGVEGSGRYSWRTMSHSGTPEASWQMHARASITVLPSVPPQLADEVPADGEPLPRGWEQLSGSDLYQQLAGPEMPINSRFSWLDRVRWSSRQAVAWWRLPEQADEVQKYPLHPGLLEGVVHLLAPWGELDNHLASVTPLRVDAITFWGRPQGRITGQAQLRQDHRHEDRLVVDVTLYDEAGAAVVRFDGLQVRFERRSAETTPQRERLYEVAWRPVAWQPNEQAASNAGWLVVAEATDPLADELTTRLGRGSACQRVTPSEALATLAKDGQKKLNVVYLAGGSAEGGEPVTGSLRECNQVQELAQALTSRRGTPPGLWVVTHGCQPVGGEEQPLRLGQAPLWGLGRNLTTAYDDFRCVLVDLDPDESADAQVRLLVEELTRPDGETEVAFRTANRYVARLAKSSVEPLNGVRLSLRGGATYLITDGVSGPGLTVAQWFADKGARHLLLTSKSAVSAEAEKALAKLRDIGVTVQVEMIDVARRDDLARVIARCGEALPPLRGVVHAAGILDDAAWQELGRRRLAGVIAPKTAGAWHLHELTRDMDLEFFILFSSASALLGSEGQAGYAAANAFLDGLAWHRKAAELPALVVNWGPWDNSVAASGARRRYWDGLGIDATPAGDMLTELETLLVHEATQATVVTVNWLRVAGEQAQKMRLLHELATPEPTAITEEMISAIRGELEVLEGEERKARLQQYLDQQLSRVAGMKPGELDPHQPLNTLGLDSLMVLDLLTDMQDKLRVAIPVEQLMQGANLDQLAGELSRSLDAPPVPVESGRN